MAATRPIDSSTSWPTRDRVGLALCWGAGLALCFVAALIVGYMAYKGITQLKPKLIFEHPTGSVDQSKAGGFLDPIEGTVLLTLIGMVIAVPIGVAVAVWLVEFGRPAPLARAVESAVEIIAGTPSIVLALFGLAVFSSDLFALLSFKQQGAGVFGRSFFVGGIMMSLIALPLVVASTREALMQVPNHVREASYALGKTKAATIRRVLLPAVRPGIATGTALGMGRVIGDTAIVILLLGGTLSIEPYDGGVPIVDTLRGTGQTLTSYVYNNSPSGEGNAPQKAYAAAFLLLLVVIGLNALAARIAAGRKEGVSWSR